MTFPPPELRVEMRGEMAELRGELQGEMIRLGARIDAQQPRFLWANVPIMFATAGLVLGAARLA